MKQLALKLAHLLALGKMQPLVVLPFGQLDLQRGIFLDLYPHLEYLGLPLQPLLPMLTLRVMLAELLGQLLWGKLMLLIGGKLAQMHASLLLLWVLLMLGQAPLEWALQ